MDTTTQKQTKQNKNKNYYRPPQGNNKKSKNNIQKSNENNSRQNTNENMSYISTGQVFSDWFLGFNVFDMFQPERLKSVIRDPMNPDNNKILRDMSLILYGTNGVYTNTVDYMTAMPTLDRVVVTHGKTTRSAEKKRKQAKALMESTLRTIKDKEIVRDALFKGMIEGIAFYYFETTQPITSNKKYLGDSEIDATTEINELGINASIISLPADYTKIVGIKNSSYVIAFDLSYFSDISNTSVREKALLKYPKEIRDAYLARTKGALDASDKWVVLDNSKTIVHKIRSKRDEPYGRPLVLAAINDILYGDYFSATKRGVLEDINNRIIYQTFPEGKDKGTSALTRQQQQNQHDTVKSAVLSKNNRNGISFFSVAAGTKIDSIDAANTDIFDDKYESNLNDKISLDMGIAGALLNGVGSGTYASQVQNLELITAQLFQWIEQISEELNKCISANIIQDDANWAECRYLPITNVNKNSMVQNAKELYLQGKGSLSLWASACGIAPDIFFALLDQELEEDIENKYPVHLTSYVYSSKDRENAGGRPTTDTPTDSTIASRANNGNAMPSPSDNM